MVSFKKIISKFDIEKFLIDNGIEYEDKTATHYIVETCPFCGKSKRKLYIDKENKTFYCFLCEAGRKQTIINFVEQELGISYNEALKIVKGKFRPQAEGLPQDFFKIEKVEKKEEREELKTIKLPYNFFSLNYEQFEDGRQYAHSRGIDDELIEKYDLRYCPAMKRLIFPVIIDGSYVGWQGRDVTDKWINDKNYPKSQTSKYFKKSLMLYNYDNVYNNEHVIITEGPVDAIKCDKIGSVALFGKTPSNRQYELIRSMPNLKSVTLALDPEEVQAMNKLAKKLSSFYDVFILEFPKGTDAGDYTTEEVYTMYSHKRKPYDYMEIIL